MDMSGIKYSQIVDRREVFTLGRLRALVAQLDGASNDLPVTGRVSVGGHIRELTVEVTDG